MNSTNQVCSQIIYTHKCLGREAISYNQLRSRLYCSSLIAVYIVTSKPRTSSLDTHVKRRFEIQWPLDIWRVQVPLWIESLSLMLSPSI